MADIASANQVMDVTDGGNVDGQMDVIDLGAFVRDLSFDEDLLSDDVSLEGLEHELEECKDDDVVANILSKGIKLRDYTKTVEKNLREVELDSIQDYEAESDYLLSLHDQIRNCDIILSQMESLLSGFQAEIGSILSAHFRAYIQSLEKWQLDIATSSDLIGIEVGGATGLFSTRREPLKNRSSVFALGDRINILKVGIFWFSPAFFCYIQEIDQPAPIPHIAEASSQKYPYEVLFPSFHKLLIETASSDIVYGLDDAFDRARQLYLSYYRSIPKSLERSTAHKLMVAMLNGDERFVEPTPESLQKLTLQSVKEAVMNQFVGGNMEVSIVGDFSEEEIESCILDYLGTVSTARDFDKELIIDPITFRPPSDMQFQLVFLKDTDERACAYIAGPAPNRWGLTVDGADLFESIEQTKSMVPSLDGSNKLQSKIQGHPLFFGITMGLLAEVINSRLFTTVRDSLGLTYDVSFELNLFDRLNFGWYVISVTSTPGKVHKAVDACKNVLRGLHSNKIAPRELDRAKRTLLMKHEAEIKANAYWLGLLAHLQADSVPRKDLTCIKDLIFLYESATIEDVYFAYEQLKVDEDSLFSCIGVAGAQAGDDISGILITV